MPIHGVTQHAARIAAFDAERQRALPAPPLPPALEQMENRSIDFTALPDLDSRVETGAGPPGPASGSSTVRGVLVLLTLSSIAVNVGDTPCAGALVAAGGLTALGQPVLAGGVLLPSCLPAVQGRQHGSLTHQRKVLCRRLLEQAQDRHFVTGRAAIVRDIDALAALVTDMTLGRANLAAIGQCLGEVRQRLNQQLAAPLRAHVAAAEEPAGSIEEPLRVLRLAMLLNQLEPVDALDRLLTATIVRANRAYLQRSP